MKTKKNFSAWKDLVHAWANQQLPAESWWDYYSTYSRLSRNGDRYVRSMMSDGISLYSYGKHFLLAKHLLNDKGEVLVYINPDRHSNSTASQQSVVRSATRHLPHVNWPSEELAACAAADLRVNSANATTIQDKFGLLVDARRANSHAMIICEHFGITFDEYIADDVAMAAQQELLRPEYEEYLRKKQERATKAMATRIANGHSSRSMQSLPETRSIDEWREGKGEPYFAGMHQRTAGYDILRIKSDMVQTSQGVQIPIAEAKRVWPILQRCRKTLVAALCPLTVNDRNGSAYSLRTINDRHFVIGCHTILWPEAEHIATALGLSI